MWAHVDLHLHTTASDGRGSPEEVVAAAAGRGIDVIAITDHHTLDGYRAAREAGENHGVLVLPGVEIDCLAGRSGVHLLGIFPPKTHIARTVKSRLGLSAVSDLVGGNVPYGLIDAVNRIRDAGGLCIAAHARSSKGLLEECRGAVLAQLMAECSIDAIELGHKDKRPPELLAGVPAISGSDAHRLTDWEDDDHPYGVGSRAFWADLPTLDFEGLVRAFRDGAVSVDAPWLSMQPDDRLNLLLQIDKRRSGGKAWVHFVENDAHERRGQAVDGVLDLLRNDGGVVYVGVRPRFNGATRGAVLDLSGSELHRLVAEQIHPTPVLLTDTFRGSKGQIHELTVLKRHNPARGYGQRDRAVARRAVRADRDALSALGVLDRRALIDAIQRAGRAGVLPADRLRALFPYRDWFDDIAECRRVIVLSLVELIAAAAPPERWALHWASELGGVREALRDRHAAAVRAQHLAQRRETLRDRLNEAVKAGSLTKTDQRQVQTYFEQHAKAAAETSAPPPAAGVDGLRRRAAELYGNDFSTQLDAEAATALKTFQEALRIDRDDAATVVLEVAPGEQVPWDKLDEAGVTAVLSGDAPLHEGVVITVNSPDPYAELTAEDLLALWAGDAPPPADAVGHILRRSIEVARRMPVMRAIAGVDRDELEGHIAALSSIGYPQYRNSVVGDLRAVLGPVDPAAPPADLAALADSALVGGALDAPAVARLEEAARLEPDAVADLLAARDDLTAALRRAAGPGNRVSLRADAIPLAALTGDERLRDWWETETQRPVRIALARACGYLGRLGHDVDGLLSEALRDNAGVISAATEAALMMGERGQRMIEAALPETDETGRGYVIQGLIDARRVPGDDDAIRRIAAAAASGLEGTPLRQLAKLDRALHLRERQAELAN